MLTLLLADVDVVFTLAAMPCHLCRRRFMLSPFSLIYFFMLPLFIADCHAILRH